MKSSRERRRHRKLASVLWKRRSGKAKSRNRRKNGASKQRNVKQRKRKLGLLHKERSWRQLGNESENFNVSSRHSRRRVRPMMRGLSTLLLKTVPRPRARFSPQQLLLLLHRHLRLRPCQRRLRLRLQNPRKSPVRRQALRRAVVERPPRNPRTPTSGSSASLQTASLAIQPLLRRPLLRLL